MVFLGIAIYRPVVVSSGYLVVDLVVSAFFTITLTALISGVLFKVFRVAMAKKVQEKEFKALFGQK